MAVEMTFEALVSALAGVTIITNDGVTEGVTVSGTTANVYNVTVTSRQSATPFPTTLVDADLSGVTFKNSSEPSSVADTLQNMFTAEHEALTTLKFMNIAISAYYELTNTIVACPTLTYIEVNEIHRGVTNFIKDCPHLETVIFNGVIDIGARVSGAVWSLNNLITNCPRLKYVRFKESVHTGSNAPGSNSMTNKLITNNNSIDNSLVVVMDKGFSTKAAASPNIKELFKNAGLKSIKCPSIVLACYDKVIGTIYLDSAFEGNPALIDFDIPVIYPTHMSYHQGSSSIASHDVSLTNMFKGCTSLKYIDLSCLKTYAITAYATEPTQLSTGMLEDVTDAIVLYSSKLVRDSEFTEHGGTNITFVDTDISMTYDSKGVPHVRAEGTPIAMLSSVLPLADPDLDITKVQHLYRHVVTIKIQPPGSAPGVIGFKTFYTPYETEITTMSTVFKCAEGNFNTSGTPLVYSVVCDSGARTTTAGVLERAIGLTLVNSAINGSGTVFGIYTYWNNGYNTGTTAGGTPTVSDKVTQIF